MGDERMIPSFTGTGAGRAFEQLVLERLRSSRECDAGRYGVQTTVIGSNNDGTPRLVAIKSLPDIEGVFDGGRQFIFDCKVCSAASFDLTKYRLTDEQKGSKSRQLSHMLSRAGHGAVCFFLIHWNARELKTKTEGAETYAFPVRRDHQFWKDFLASETATIRRADCYEYGVKVEWDLAHERERKERPNVLQAIRQMSGQRNTLRMVGSWGL